MSNQNMETSDLTQVAGGSIRPHKTLNVLVASRWLMEPEHFCQLSLEDQAALTIHATDELWLDTFLHEGAKKGIEIIYQAYVAGMV